MITKNDKKMTVIKRLRHNTHDPGRKHLQRSKKLKAYKETTVFARFWCVFFALGAELPSTLAPNIYITQYTWHHIAPRSSSIERDGIVVRSGWNQCTICGHADLTVNRAAESMACFGSPMGHPRYIPVPGRHGFCPLEICLKAGSSSFDATIVPSYVASHPVVHSA